MKKSLFIVFLTILALSAQAQNKEIFADTASYVFKSRTKYPQQANLPDLLQSTNDFHFRYSSFPFGQIVDVWKNNDSLGGSITNYVKHSYGFKRRKKETIIKSHTIDSTTLPQVYELVCDSVVWNLPDDSEIKDWGEWVDGTLYYLEYATDKGYWIKSYKNPEGEKTLQEAIIITLFIKQLDTVLQLTESRERFKEDRPKRGCYHYPPMSECYPRSYSFSVGYFGSVRLPFGYQLSLRNIGAVNTKFGVYLEHRFNTNNSYDFSADFDRTLFDKKNLYGSLCYNYRQRYWKEIMHRNHKIYYGQEIKVGKRWLRIGAGVDFLNNNNQEIGGIINIGSSLPYKLPSIGLQTSIFKQRIDYKINLSKLFRIQKIGQTFSANVFFERFMERNDIGFGLSTSL